MSITDAQFEKAFKILGIPTAAWRELDMAARCFAGYKDRVYVVYDQTPQVQEVKLYGLSRGTNTDAYGNIYASCASSTGSWIAKLYKNSARTSQVASGIHTTCNTSQTVTLTSKNSSGLSGTMKLSAHSADESDIKLIPRYNFVGLADDLDPTVTLDTDLSDQYAAALSSWTARCTAIANGLLSQRGACETEMTNIIKSVFAELINSGNMVSGDLLSGTVTTTGGQVTYTYSGILKDLYDAMSTNSAFIKMSTVSFGTVTSGAGQQGRLSATTKTPTQYVEADDTIRIECVKTLDSAKEEFTVKSKKYGEANYQMRLGQAFQAPEIGIKTMTFNRKIQMTGSAITDHAASNITSGTATITGETSTYVDLSNSALYGKLTTSGSWHSVALYSDSTRSACVAYGTRTGAGSVTCAEYGSSGITFVCTIVGAPETSNFQVDLNIGQVEDYWEMTASNNETGVFSYILGRVFKYDLPASASPTIPDSYTTNWDDFVYTTYHRS